MQQRPTLYLKGTFNGWGLDTPFNQITPQLYKADVVFSADNHQFKIADMDGTEQWTLSGNPTLPTKMELAQSISLISTQGIGNDLLFSPTSTGRFSLELDLSNPAPILTIQRGGKSNQDKPNRALTHFSLNNQEEPQNEPSLPAWALNPELLFEQLAIESNQSFPFVFGDNVDGYYEGRTHCFVSAGRYRHHQGWYLGGFGSFVDGKLNDKCQASNARLLPYGVEHQYSASSDCFSLVQKQRLACLSVSSERESQLSILPELNLAIDDCQIEQHQDVVVITVNPELCQDGAPKYIAISANQPVIVEEVESAQYPDIEDKMFIGSNNCKLMISSANTTHNLTVYLSFEHEKQPAIAEAKAASEKNAKNTYQQAIYQFLTKNYLWTNDIEYNRAVMWARLASRVFVSHEFGTGIWAGLPWFKDCWGRDTFIALSGTSLINGEFAESKAIIENFASMQMQDETSVNFGRIPNRVTSKTNIIYNTTDGTPWMIREILEYINYSGDMAFGKAIYPVVQRFISGVERHYLDDDGLIKHRHPDTWMDAKINGQTPWSPRGPKANDIQALWFESLQVALQLAKLNQDKAYLALIQNKIDKVKSAFSNKFWDSKRSRMADRLESQDQPDYSIRPNQLLTLTIPQGEQLVDPMIGQYIIKQSVENLLFPWGICSLDQNHVDFHPYHDNRPEYHKDAAYHNGTIWGWNSGFTISALAQFGKQELAYQLSKNLTDQILNQGHRGTMSENLDAFQSDMDCLVETGTYAQAWSVSEFARNAQQDYLGFKPKLSLGQILLKPRLPSSWHTTIAQLPFGENNALIVSISRTGDSLQYEVTPQHPAPEISVLFTHFAHTQALDIEFDLSKPITLTLDDWNTDYTVSRSVLNSTHRPVKEYPELRQLDFATPNLHKAFETLNTHDFLLKKRQKDKLDIDRDNI